MARHTSAPFFVYRNPALFENASLQAKTVCKLRSDNSLHLSQPVFSRKNRPVSSYGLQKPACQAKPLFHRHVKEGRLSEKRVPEPVKNLQDQPRGKERQMVMPGSTGTARSKCGSIRSRSRMHTPAWNGRRASGDVADGKSKNLLWRAWAGYNERKASLISGYWVLGV